MGAARILILDSDPAVLSTFSRVLQGEGFEPLPTTSPSRALELIHERPPVDLVLADSALPIAALPPQIPAVMLTGAAASPADVPPNAWLLRKPVPTQELIFTVRVLLIRTADARADLERTFRTNARLRRQSGETVRQSLQTCSQTAEARMRIAESRLRDEERFRRFSEQSQRCGLTPREIQVLLHLAEGLTTTQIAAELAVSPGTAAMHRQNILKKLLVHGTVPAVRWAIRMGLIEP
jgi:DNA-binding NarL/FixJ family response regulator